MAAIKEMNCQINISGIEEHLKTLTEDDNAGRIILKKEVVTGNISRLRFNSTKSNIIIDGIYLIHVVPPGTSHAIVLQISNNGKNFDVFDPNGKKWVNEDYTLEVYVDDDKKNLKKSLSPDKVGLNGEGICGIWSIIISILLNGIVKEIFTEEDKEVFYDFLNDDIEGPIEFIQDIKTNFFDGTKQYQSKSEVNKFLKYIRDLLREIIDEQKKNHPKIVAPPRTSKRLSIGGKKSRKSSTSTSKSRSKSRTKSRSKSRTKSRSKSRSKSLKRK